MTYALIDNATLTAVQRLMGQASTKSKDSVDTDIIALESYIQAILFYDNVIAIDDYIPKYRNDRLASFPNVAFLNATDFNLDHIEETAADKARELRPKLQGGEFANDEFRQLLELLQTHIVCTWDISSSVYHLTLKSLSEEQSDFDKYGNIAASIFSELGDASISGHRVSGDVELVDRFGNKIRKGYQVPGAKWGNGESTGEASGAIKAFVASLVWLANRSIFYSLTAKYLKADTFLYPIRQAYQQSYISQTCNYGFGYAKHIVENFSTSLSKDLIDIQNGGLATATSTQLPVFSAWLAAETGDPTQIIDAALTLRENSEFAECRDMMREIRRLFDEEDIGDANRAVSKIIQDVDKAANDMRIKYGLKTRQGIPVTKIVQVYNSYAALTNLPQVPEWDFKVKLPEFLYGLRRKRGFRAVYRNLTQDLSTVWKLGEARDILGSRVVIDEEAVAYNPKREEPRYRFVHSKFKSPM